MSAQEDSLLAALQAAERANMHADVCRVCQALPQMSESARVAVERALAGTIGGQKLADILTQSGYDVSRRAVMKHRREGCTP